MILTGFFFTHDHGWHHGTDSATYALLYGVYSEAVEGTDNDEVSKVKDIINKTVHDTHGFRWNTSIRMYLLQHFVSVDSITFLTLFVIKEF